MAHESEEDGHSGHESVDLGAWMDHHLSGLVVPLGKRLESVIERLLFLFVNGLMQKFAVLVVVIMTPVVLLEIVLNTVRL